MIDSKIRKIPTVLAAAGLVVALVLGFALNPSPTFANKPDGNGDHNHGDGGGDTGTTFSVDVLAGTGPTFDWVVTEGEGCKGLTSKNLNVTFPAGCGLVVVDDGFLDLYLFSIAVRNTKKETSVVLFFTSGLEVSPVPNETVYESDRLPAMIEPESAGFAIVVDETNENLIKIHQPNKGDVVGFVSVGTIVYTSTP